MENKENGIFVNTLLDLLESDNITNEINKKIIEDSIEIAYRNIELKKKNQELYNQIDNLERKNKKLERRIIELMKQYRDKTNEFTDIKIKNEKAIAYLKNKENFDGEFFLHTSRLVQKVLLSILEKGE